jgi:hypothetical protein
MDIAELRRQCTEDLRAANGDAWVEVHSSSPEAQCEFLVEGHFLD